MQRKYSILKQVYVSKDDSDGLYIVDVDSEGDTLRELLDNATCGLEDQYGNTVQHCMLSDLSGKNYAEVVEYLLEAYDNVKKEEK